MNLSDANMEQADPSDVGQHYNLVRGPYIWGDFFIYSRVYLSLNWE